MAGTSGLAYYHVAVSPNHPVGCLWGSWCQQPLAALSHLGGGWLSQLLRAPPARPCWEAAAPRQPQLGCHPLLVCPAPRLSLAASSLSSSPSHSSSSSQGPSCPPPGQGKGDERTVAELPFHPAPSRERSLTAGRRRMGRNGRFSPVLPAPPPASSRGGGGSLEGRERGEG